MKRDVRRTVAAGLVAAIGFVALPAMAARDAIPVALEREASDGHRLVSYVVSLLGSWFQVLMTSSEEALEAEASPPNPGGGTGQESPGFQDQGRVLIDPDG